MKKDFVQHIADKAARAATEGLREHLQDVVHEIADDQRVWLDNMMRDILPPPLYEAGKRGDNLNEVGAYLKKHKISIVMIPDSIALRIMIGDTIHSQFIPQLTLDGEPLSKTLESAPELN